MHNAMKNQKREQTLSKEEYEGGWDVQSKNYISSRPLGDEIAKAFQIDNLS